MSFKFILDILIMLSLAGILFIIARTLPKIDDSDVHVPESSTPWVIIYLEKIDEQIRVSTEKLLRRFRVAILKLDNSVSKQINNYKKDTENKNDILEIKDED